VLGASLKKIVARKLDLLDYSEELKDLASPRETGSKPPKGDIKGLHSIRINDQWRVVFRRTDAGPVEVEIRDYR